MLRPIVCAALLLMASCAPEPTTRVVTKTRHCTTTIAPMSHNEFCRVELRCDVVTSCGEAYYRYTACDEWKRDGGVAGERNGIPCQKLCGKNAMEMATRIKGEAPFTPPMRKVTACSPA